jgi:hypothetical protein
VIYSYEVNGLPIQTGDVICTTSIGVGNITHKCSLFLGRLIPGEVDHVAIYVGPEGWCVEAELWHGVVTFELKNKRWLAEHMLDRRHFIDRFYGVAYPLQGKDLSSTDEAQIRENVAGYCLDQAAAHKPYNLWFWNSTTTTSFYCSHLIYKAYLSHGINLNTELGVPNIIGCHSIVFPQEIWNGCANLRAAD